MVGESERGEQGERREKGEGALEGERRVLRVRAEELAPGGNGGVVRPRLWTLEQLLLTSSRGRSR